MIARIVITGGGFPPPPVALQVDVDGQPHQGVAFGPQIFQPAGRGFRTPLSRMVVPAHRQLNAAGPGLVTQPLDRKDARGEGHGHFFASNPQTGRFRVLRLKDNGTSC